MTELRAFGNKPTLCSFTPVYIYIPDTPFKLKANCADHDHRALMKSLWSESALFYSKGQVENLHKKNTIKFWTNHNQCVNNGLFKRIKWTILSNKSGTNALNTVYFGNKLKTSLAREKLINSFFCFCLRCASMWKKVGKYISQIKKPLNWLQESFLFFGRFACMPLPTLI